MTTNLRIGQANTSQVVEVALAGGGGVLVLEEVTPPRSWPASRVPASGRRSRTAWGSLPPGRPARWCSRATGSPHVRRLHTEFAGYGLDLATPASGGHLIAVHPRPPVGDVSGWRMDHGVIRHAARATSDRTMVVGDLNATMDHVPLRTLVGGGFEDAATQADSGWQPTWPAAGKVSRLGVPVPSMVAIDHVLLKPGCAPAHGHGHRRGHRPPRAARGRRAVTREEALAWRPDAEDQAFGAVYGDWDPLTPAELRDLMAGYPEPWWVVGGWSVEAFTGIPRFHEDIDLVVYAEHVPALREQPVACSTCGATPVGRCGSSTTERPSRSTRSARSGCARTPAPRGGSTAS